MAELQRSVALKVRISGIINGSYVKTDGLAPNYVEINGKKISKVNMIGTVILKQEDGFKSLMMDDGSGAIQIMFFEENAAFSRIAVGDSVMVIGRPREYMASKYIIPDLIKRVDDARLIRLRKLELDIENPGKNAEEEKAVTETENSEDEENSYHKVLSAVREFDLGDGADFEAVLGLIKQERGEETIRKLIEKGELFEVKPGRLKIL